MRLLAFMFALALWSSAVSATPSAAVRTALDAGDLDALERIMHDLHQDALRMRNADTLREIYAQFFSTTHPERRATVEKWQAAYRQSPYAAAAGVNIAILDATYSRADGEQKRHEGNDGVLKFATEATTLSQDFAPSLEAWLVAVRPMGGQVSADWAIEQLMEISPTHETALLAMNALSSGGMGGRARLAEFCVEYGDSIPDYGHDPCLLDVIFTLRNLSDLRNDALAALSTYPTPLLDGARARAALEDGYEMPNAAEKVFAWHLSQLKPGVDIIRFGHRTAHIARQFDRPDFEEKGQQAIRAYVDARLNDDPFNSSLVLARTMPVALEPNSSKDAVAEARAIWRNALVHGSNQTTTWEIGARLAAFGHHPSDVLSQIPFWENLAATSTGSPYGAWNLFRVLHGPYGEAKQRLQDGKTDDGEGPDPEATVETLSCPMLRAARVTEGLCRSSQGGGTFCDPEHETFRNVLLIIDEGRNGLCDTVAETPLRRLSYELNENLDLISTW